MKQLMALMGALFVLTGVVLTAPVAARPALMAMRDTAEVQLVNQGGGLWVDARINGRAPVRMMIDTGSTLVILPESVARTLRVPLDGPQQTMKTLHGTVMGRRVTLDALDLGPYRVSSVPAVVIAGAGVTEALLGRSFLDNFSYSFDLDRQVLALQPRALVGAKPRPAREAIQRALAPYFPLR